MLSVVLPCYQEAENLKIILPRIKNILSKVGEKSEILVIDAPIASDDTKSICEELGIICINQRGEGFGSAIKTGIKEANGEYVIFMDADGMHPPEYIIQMYALKDEYDVIIASRYIKGAQTVSKPEIILMSRILNLVFSWILKIRCSDLSTNFKLYRSSQLKRLDLHSRNFDIVEEIIFKLKKQNPQLAIKEIPASTEERIFGRTKRKYIPFIISYIKTLIRLRFSR